MNNLIKYLIYYISLLLTDGYTDAPGSFLFSLRNNDNLQPFKLPLKDENNAQAISRRSDGGPTFGGPMTFQLLISDNARSNENSLALNGDVYQPPDAYRKTLLAGSEGFKPSEVEVLYLN